MIFSTLLPVALFIFVPFIIILYFLRPRGKDTKISSNLLWKQLFEKTTSRTTRSRFVRDILLVLQLLIVVLLIFALMAPHIRTKSRTETNILMLIDTSAGMQHTEGQKTRLEKALEDAVGMVEDAGDTSFTILTRSPAPMLPPATRMYLPFLEKPSLFLASSFEISFLQAAATGIPTGISFSLGSPLRMQDGTSLL